MLSSLDGDGWFRVGQLRPGVGSNTCGSPGSVWSRGSSGEVSVPCKGSESGVRPGGTRAGQRRQPGRTFWPALNPFLAGQLLSQPCGSPRTLGDSKGPFPWPLGSLQLSLTSVDPNLPQDIST